MNKLMSAVTVGASVLALAAAPAALASGGSGSGGGGGGTGGGTTSGGVNDATGSTSSSAPCVKLGNVSDPTGYFSTFAAIWHDYTLKSCSSATQDVTLTVTDTDTATGQVDFSSSGVYTLGASQNVNGMIDNDYAPFSTSYSVKTTATDAAGNVLASQTILASTPAPK